MKVLLGKYKVAEWATEWFILAKDEDGLYRYQMQGRTEWEDFPESLVRIDKWICLEEYQKVDPAHQICLKVRRMEKRQNARKQSVSKLSSEGAGQEGGSPLPNERQENVALPAMRVHGEGLIGTHVRLNITYDSSTNRIPLRAVYP